MFEYLLYEHVFYVEAFLGVGVEISFEIQMNMLFLW